jgi:hypothetical protein
VEGRKGAGRVLSSRASQRGRGTRDSNRCLKGENSLHNARARGKAARRRRSGERLLVGLAADPNDGLCLKHPRMWRGPKVCRMPWLKPQNKERAKGIGRRHFRVEAVARRLGRPWVWTKHRALRTLNDLHLQQLGKCARVESSL